jgi:hypothetical protein
MGNHLSKLFSIQCKGCTVILISRRINRTKIWEPIAKELGLPWPRERIHREILKWQPGILVGRDGDRKGHE